MFVKKQCVIQSNHTIRLCLNIDHVECNPEQRKSGVMSDDSPCKPTRDSILIYIANASNFTMYLYGRNLSVRLDNSLKGTQVISHQLKSRFPTIDQDYRSDLSVLLAYKARRRLFEWDESVELCVAITPAFLTKTFAVLSVFN